MKPITGQLRRLNNMKPQHTPTPELLTILHRLPIWSKGDVSLEDLAKELKLFNYEPELTQEEIADYLAENIVKCVNSHDELVACLNQLVHAFYNDEPKDYHERKGSYYESIKKLYAKDVERAEQALAKAGE